MLKLGILRILPCLLVISALNVSLFGQAVHKEGSPPSRLTKLDIAAPTVELPQLDLAKLIAEDQKAKLNNELFRFGYVHEVQYSLDNSGEWTTLANGDREYGNSESMRLRPKQLI